MLNKKRQYMIFDFETFSKLNLKDFGAYEYSLHPSTDVICLSFAIGTREDFKRRTFKVHTWSPWIKDLKPFHAFEKALFNKEIKLVAHNAFFDANILKNTFSRRLVERPDLRWGRFRCTMAMCQAMALPRSLEDAAIALKLLQQKDKEGNRLVKKWCKPRKPSQSNAAIRHMDMISTDEKARAEFERIVAYCESDIRVTAEIFSRLPMLTSSEQELWELTQTVNARGFGVDRKLVNTVLRLIDVEGRFLDARLQKITGGKVESGTKTQQLKNWIAGEGFELEDLKAKTVVAAVKSPDTPPRVRKALRIRQARSMSSTAKYLRFEAISRSDSRARGGLVYHAALTGRWAGALLNPQNFPRGTVKDAVQAAEIVSSGDRDLVQLIYGNPMAVYSSCLRTMIIPSEGHVFDVADYSQIEVRVLFWLARHAKGLEVFSDKTRDIYVEQASAIFNMPIEQIGKESFERFVGKEAILGCGYQLGAQKLQSTLADKGHKVSLDFCQRVIQIYRRTNYPVANLWRNLEYAALRATAAPGKEFEAGRCVYKSDGAFLYCTLPSGRRIAYQEPKITRELKYGEWRHVLNHWMVDVKTKKRAYRGTYGGKLCENISQATARDIMAHAKLNIEKSKIWKLVLSVHDEAIAERSVFAKEGIEDFIKLMESIPDWAKGCPIVAGGWSGDRYRK